MSEVSTFLINRMNVLEADAYTERDGGDWYVVAGGGEGRLAEGFSSRDDARRFICWVCGDPCPPGWKIVRTSALGIDLELRRDRHGCEFATVWVRDLSRYVTRRAGAGKPYRMLP